MSDDERERTDDDDGAAAADSEGGGPSGPTPPSAAVPVVGVGASAGGLAAFTEFLEAISPDSGMAYVLVQHLDPDHESLMAELLSTHTAMTVVQAEDAVVLEADHVYVIAPGSTLRIDGGTLRPGAPERQRGARWPIDTFFLSLAAERGAQAIGIVLSGTGTDGTQGLRAIREAGGLALVQEPAEAAFDGMPRSAMIGGAVDQVMPIGDMPAALIGYVAQPYFRAGVARRMTGERARSILADVVAALKRRTLVDFDCYREGTLLRRIERRMGIAHLDAAAAYLERIRSDPLELDRLYADLLINVTGFFRDGATFEHLGTAVLPDLVRDHPGDRAFRVWVAGCASGEEAYSVAMLLTEVAESLGRELKLQLFATDLDAEALAIGREGRYPESIESDVTPARLARFFVKEDHHYHVLPELREAVVFARHDLLADPPFSRLDMISCRNMLIYLEAGVQARIMELFHFGLRGHGTLLLGSSESVAGESGLFETISREHRLYRRSGIGLRHAEHDARAVAGGRSAELRSLLPRVAAPPVVANVGKIAQRLLLERYAPAAVLLNRRFQGLYFSGPTDRYLRVPDGEAGQDVLAMVRDGLRGELRAVVQAVLESGESMQSDFARAERDGGSAPVLIRVEPFDGGDEPLLLVTFTEAGGAVAPASPIDTEDRSTVDRLEAELVSSRRELNVTIRDLEASNEELKAANEEAVSMNEEFRSTNEELETSREELQSLNEELTTLNTQLQHKVDEHRGLVDDLSNLINGTRIATIFLDTELRIKRFTPAARELFHLIASDVGRPLEDVRQRFEDEELLVDAARVLDAHVPVQTEVRSDGGRWHVRTLLPYRTTSKRVDGLVVTFQDVTDIKLVQQSAVDARRYAEAIIDTVREPLVVLDAELDVVSANQAFVEIYSSADDVPTGRSLFAFDEGRWNVSALREQLNRAVAEGASSADLELDLPRPDDTPRTLRFVARAIHGDAAGSARVLLAIEDVTLRRAAERCTEERAARLSSILESAQVAIVTYDECGIVSSFSRTAERVFGYAADEVIGLELRALVPELGASGRENGHARAPGGGEAWTNASGREVVGRRKDGREMPLDLVIGEARVRDVPLYTAVMRDVTLEKARHEELRQAQKMDAMGQLTGGVAHDFNNLLTVIIGNLELLDDARASDEHREFVAEAIKAARSGAELTGDLLAFGRRMPLQLETLDINDVVSRFGGILRRTVPESIGIRTELDSAVWPVVSDVARIQNALLNLILNAVSAMPDGGTLTIRTANVTLGEDEVRGLPDAVPGHYVALSVGDTGAGMSAEVRQRAFEPFYTTREAGTGSGLGLSMVYGFARQSGGHALILSAVGQGTTVTLHLPRGRPATVPSAAAAADEPGRPRGGAETVLVVEDDPMVRKLTLRRLGTLGYTVLEAATAAAALALLGERDDIELMFSDVILAGGMTGSELVREARRAHPGLKLLLTSGYTADALDVESDVLLLRKPYTLETLATKLREVLDA